MSITSVLSNRYLSRFLSDFVHGLFIYPAQEGWMKGFPKEEVAFMNRLTEKMLEHKSILTQGSPIVSWELFKLHRQGQGRTDLFGCDLAITFNMTSKNRKTAFFQIKRKKYKSNLKSQIEDSVKQLGNLNYPPKQSKFIRENSFVFFLDDEYLTNRITSFDDYLAQNINGTLSSEKWFTEWFFCNIGKPDGGDITKSILDPYKLASIDESNAEQPLLLVSPLAWLSIEIDANPEINERLFID